MELGIKHNPLAVYDLGKGEEIRVQTPEQRAAREAQAGALTRNDTGQFNPGTDKGIFPSDLPETSTDKRNLANKINDNQAIPGDNTGDFSMDKDAKFKKSPAPPEIQAQLDAASKELGWKKTWAPGAMKSERFQWANELSKALTGREIITYTSNEGEHGFAMGRQVFVNARSMCLASRKCNKRQKINAAPGMVLLFNFGMLQPVTFAAEY